MVIICLLILLQELKTQHMICRGNEKDLLLYEFYNHRATNFRAQSGTDTSHPFTQTSENLLCATQCTQSWDCRDERRYPPRGAHLHRLLSKAKKYSHNWAHSWLAHKDYAEHICEGSLAQLGMRRRKAGKGEGVLCRLEIRELELRQQETFFSETFGSDAELDVTQQVRIRELTAPSFLW